MDVHRQGDQFAGSVRRTAYEDDVPFWGVLELVAALDGLVERIPARDCRATARDRSDEV